MAPRIESRLGSPQVPFLTRRKVLLVEEDSRDLRYYSAILEQQGYEVKGCPSYAEGLRSLGGRSFDFIIVSQGSRAFEGRTLLERVLTIDRRTPVLVLTRCVDMGCYLDAMQMGAVDYLEKPLAPSDLTRVVKTHLRPQNVAA
jgi:DNA-binding response OmpR family regulator